jgi:hypothetical protein
LVDTLKLLPEVSRYRRLDRLHLRHRRPAAASWLGPGRKHHQRHGRPHPGPGRRTGARPRQHRLTRRRQDPALVGRVGGRPRNPLSVAARNRNVADAQSRAISGAQSVRTSMTTNARYLRLSARSVRRTQDHKSRRTLYETNSRTPSDCKTTELTAAGESRNPGWLDRMPVAGPARRWRWSAGMVANGWCHKRWCVLGMLELISGWVSGRPLGVQPQLGATARKPSVFLANWRRRPTSPRLASSQ